MGHAGAKAVLGLLQVLYGGISQGSKKTPKVRAWMGRATDEPGADIPSQKDSCKIATTIPLFLT